MTDRLTDPQLDDLERRVTVFSTPDLTTLSSRAITQLRADLARVTEQRDQFREALQQLRMCPGSNRCRTCAMVVRAVLGVGVRDTPSDS